MKPALKSGISIHSHSGGTHIRRGGSSFFVKDSRLTAHIAKILGLLDGTRSAEEVERQLPEPLAKLLRACLSQLQANGMLTNGSLAQAREAFPDVDLVGKFHDWTDDWESCVRTWRQQIVGIVPLGRARAIAPLLELLRASGARSVTACVSDDSLLATMDRIIVEIDPDDREFDRLSALLNQWQDRAIFCLRGPDQSVIFRGFVPTHNDLQILRSRYHERKGQQSELSRRICDAQIVFELARQTAEEFGLPEVAGANCKVVNANGLVRDSSWQAYLSGPADSSLAEGLQPRLSPAFGGEWFSPHGHLRFGEIDADARFPLPHVAINLLQIDETPRQVVEWGIYPHEAERNAVASGIARCLLALQPQSHDIVFRSISVAASQTEALKIATASTISQWAASRTTRFAAQAIPDAWSTLGSRCRLLLRILSGYDADPVSIRTLAVRSGAVAIVWINFGDTISMGFGPTLEEAAEIALGDYLSLLQIGRRPPRQELPWVISLRESELYSLPGAVLEDDAGPVPEIHHRLIWEAATSHNFAKQHACGVECWL